MEEFVYNWGIAQLRDGKRFSDLLPRDPDREEAYNDAYLVFLKTCRCSSFKIKKGLAHLQYRIYEQLCIDYWRKNRARKTEGGHAVPDLEQLSPAARNNVQQFMTQDRLAAVKEILQSDAFSGKSCYVLLMWYAIGFNYQEIAQLTGKTIGTVKTQAWECRKALHKKLTEWLD